MKKEEYKVKGEDLLKKVKQIIYEGNVRRIIIKNEKGKTFMEFPLTVGAVGAVLLPVFAAIGAIAALAADYTIVVEKQEGNSGSSSSSSSSSSSGSGS